MDASWQWREVKGCHMRHRGPGGGGGGGGGGARYSPMLVQVLTTAVKTHTSAAMRDSHALHDIHIPRYTWEILYI